MVLTDLNRLVYLIAIAFGVVATICAACTKDIDHLLTNDVAASLHRPELQRLRRRVSSPSQFDKAGRNQDIESV